eukprot:CAMPEP_0204155554 /NCGR_PEP_ID=MMETSP0361-20130328/29701_1 /ASSEMBLY_ACC=CAM_ASM_000343 /TAXON_ID=268821 /ORGANISM="Scrippsiella Hangoei, Strain SHTV-5" /LENGTH=112 /DNA_ID=CAMNT_0051111065 /DNA_START=337 /DNA_END=674 /DNA_ORIENTATION=-
MPSSRRRPLAPPTVLASPAEPQLAEGCASMTSKTWAPGSSASGSSRCPPTSWGGRARAAAPAPTVGVPSVSVKSTAVAPGAAAMRDGVRMLEAQQKLWQLWQVLWMRKRGCK